MMTSDLSMRLLSRSSDSYSSITSSEQTFSVASSVHPPAKTLTGAVITIFPSQIKDHSSSQSINDEVFADGENMSVCYPSGV